MKAFAVSVGGTLRLSRGPRIKAIRTQVDGYWFDSKMEARRYQELKLIQAAGEIVGLDVHKRYPIFLNDQKICEYEGDFTYRLPGSSLEICEDVKGHLTEVYKLKIKLARACYRDVEFREV